MFLGNYDFLIIGLLLIIYSIYSWRKREIFFPFNQESSKFLFSGKKNKSLKSLMSHGPEARARSILVFLFGIFFIIIYLLIL